MARTKKPPSPPKTASRRATGKRETPAASDRRPVGQDVRWTTAAARWPNEAPPGELGRLRLELDVHRDEVRAQNEDLRQTNAALLSAKERYAQLYDGAPVAYFTLDEGFAIAEANAAGAQLLDATRNFLFGRRFDELVVPSSRESFRNYLRRVLAYGGRPIHETILASGARRFPARIEATRLAGPGFEHAHCLLCVSDETERRRAEEERLQLEATLAEAQRIESLGQLAGGISHDFNNILAIALTHAELIVDDPGSREQVAASAIEIRDAVLRASELSRQMLIYTGRGPIVCESLDLSEVIRSMRPLLDTVTLRDSLLLELEDGLPSIAGERVRVQQIILNLVVNAAEAITPKGKIRLRTRPAPAAPRTDGSAGEDRVLVEVSDDGRGMDDETRRRAFDPFFSTKFAGRGLGLSTVYGNVRAHKATVNVESIPNGGTTVRVYFPVRERAKTPATLPSWRGRGRILVVDDEEALRRALGRVLERLGFAVDYACDGLEALARVRETEPPFAAVLLDLTMPRLDGRATLSELKRLQPNLPVVLMSGAGALDNDILVAQADAYVMKPLASRDIAASVASVIRDAEAKATSS